jgi:hypothetical protein
VAGEEPDHGSVTRSGRVFRCARGPRSKGRFRQCPLKRSSESIDLGSDPSVVFYRSEFENVIQDRYGVREA